MKRLVVCCDGTWQKLSSPCPTNVVKIAQAVRPVAKDKDKTNQIVFYDQGIGTGDKFNKITGGAFGWGIDDAIQDAYRFLCLNYEPADEIYLFGFSRGAYTVRSLAGLIRCSGLLSRKNIRKAPQAYEIYRERNDEQEQDTELKRKEEKARSLNDGDRQNAHITLLGCWDTVGELGVPDQITFLPIDKWINRKYKFHDYQLSRIIQNALHAVAIDERRKVFDVTPMEKSENNPDQELRQVWFPGNHGCVGGGTENTRGLSDAALKWMMEQIKELKLGLDLDPTAVEGGINPDYKTPFDNSINFFFQLTGEKAREIIGTSKDGNPVLHESVYQRWHYYQLPYRPENLSPFENSLNAKKTPE